MKAVCTRHVTDNAKWMSCPSISTEYPGLAYLIPLTELIIVKQTDALHDIIGGSDDGFTIFNELGEKVFVAVQRKRFKAFDIKIFNLYGNEVMQVKRPFRHFLNKALVWAPPGNFVAAVKEISSCVNRYRVKNWYGVIIFEFKAIGLCNFVYKIRAYQGTVGKLDSNWKCDYSKEKHFGMSFPADMNVMDKIALIGAGMLIGCVKYI